MCCIILAPWCSKGDPWLSSMGIIWELVRKAAFQVRIRTQVPESASHKCPSWFIGTSCSQVTTLYLQMDSIASIHQMLRKSVSWRSLYYLCSTYNNSQKYFFIFVKEHSLHQKDKHVYFSVPFTDLGLPSPYFWAKQSHSHLEKCQ